MIISNVLQFSLFLVSLQTKKSFVRNFRFCWQNIAAYDPSEEFNEEVIFRHPPPPPYMLHLYSKYAAHPDVHPADVRCITPCNTREYKLLTLYMSCVNQISLLMQCKGRVLIWFFMRQQSVCRNVHSLYKQTRSHASIKWMFMIGY